MYSESDSEPVNQSFPFKQSLTHRADQDRSTSWSQELQTPRAANFWAPTQTGTTRSVPSQLLNNFQACRHTSEQRQVWLLSTWRCVSAFDRHTAPLFTVTDTWRATQTDARAFKQHAVACSSQYTLPSNRRSSLSIRVQTAKRKVNEPESTSAEAGTGRNELCIQCKTKTSTQNCAWVHHLPLLCAQK